MATKTNSKVAYTVECPQYGRIVCEAGVKLTWQAGPGRLNGGNLVFAVISHPT